MAFKLLDELHDRSLVGLADKLPWRLPLDDGLVMTNTGGFMSSYEYVGPNPETVSAQDLSSMVNDLNDTEMKLGRGWTLHYEIARQRATQYGKPNPAAPPTAQLFDAERRLFAEHSGNHFVTRLRVSAIYNQPKTPAEVASRWFFDGTDETGTPAAEEAKQEFLRGRDDFERAFSNRIALTRLGLRATLDADGEPVVYDDMMSYLYYTVRGIWQPVIAPPTGMTVAKLLAAHEVVMDWQPKIDNDAVVIINVTQPPTSSKLRHLRALEALPIEYRASLRTIMLGRSESEAYVQTKADQWFGNSTGFFNAMIERMGSGGNPKVNRHAVSLSENANQLKTRIQGGELSLVYPTFSIVLFGDNRAEALKNGDAARRALRDAGFITSIARVDAGRRYFASLPGEVHSVVPQHAWTTANVALTVPLTSVWSGVDVHPSEFYPSDAQPHIVATTTGGAQCRLPLHWNTAGHTIVVGAQRSGKSVLLKRLLLQHLLVAGTPRAFVLDRDRSMSTLATALEAEGVAAYYDLNDTSVCPLEFIHEGEAERRYAVGFVEHLCKLQNQPPTMGRRSILEDGIARMAATPQRLLSELRQFVSDPVLWAVLDRYSDETTTVGRILNGKPNGIAERRVLIFETNILSEMEPEDRNPIYRQLLHLMDRASLHGDPMQAMFDEASVYLRDAFLGNFLFEILRRWGKRNVHGVFATQGVNDIANAGDLGVSLATECKTRIFCGDTSASDQAQMDALFTFAQLSPTECAAIARNASSRSYYYVSPLGRATFNLALQAVEKALITGDEGDRLKASLDLRNRHPKDFVYQLLAKAGLEDWAGYYNTLRAQSTLTPPKEVIAA